MTRAEFNDAMSPSFNEIFNTALEFGPYADEYMDLFRMKTSTRQYEKGSYVTGFGAVPQKAEGSTVTYDAIIEGLDKTYTHNTYALAYRISQEMIEDEQYGIIGELPEALGRSMRYTINVDGANVYNNGFSNSYLDGPDGLELFSSLHPLMDGTTQRNELSSTADLSYTSLNQALIDIGDMTDDRGLALQLMPKTLVVAREGWWPAQQLLKTAAGYQSANGDINPAMGVLDLKVNHFLTDADAWFILCEGHRVTWYWRIKPQHGNGNDFDTDDSKFKTRARWSRGWDTYQGVFGVEGA